MGVLLALFVVSMVFASGVVDPSIFKIDTMSWMQPNSPGPNEISVIPAAIIKDYYNDLGYAIGDKFLVHINVTDVTDLFTWQLNLTWNPAVLNFTKKVTYGDFLFRTDSPDKTSRIVPIAGGDNVTGYGWVAETVLGDYDGVTGSGRLVSLEFQVVGYGATDLAISTVGDLPTTLLNSAGTPIAFTSFDGYFRNALSGDATLDGIVDVFDVLKVKYHRSGPPPGPGGYLREADVNEDGSIDVFDILSVKANLGRSV